MIRTDSRKIKPGDTFIAIDGISSNGSDYIPAAIKNGASKIVCKEGSFEVETINTPDTVKYLENALEKEYGSIISGMTLIGVTGTNGKTTTCYLVSQLLNSLGIPCAYIGTIGFYMDEKVRDLPNTSVDICSLYELLLEAHENGFDHVALEASSQGLDMGRLNTITFDRAAFTNLTEDHLDYHKTMENYAYAKQTLFKRLKKDGLAIINADDPGKKYFLLDENRNMTYGYESDDYKITDCSFSDISQLKFSFDGVSYCAENYLVGTYNMYNLMAAIALVNSLGISMERILEVTDRLKTPDGRCERITFEGKNVIVDYAHTPDAMEKIIESAKAFTKNNIYIVFGCTGDREREKRPEMTRIALSNCKKAVLTIDDIHDEDVDQIFDDMLAVNTMDNYEICRDRRKAIEIGLGLLEAGDTLLILGKGHEKFIIVGKQRIPHNDKEAVLEMIGDKVGN